MANIFFIAAAKFAVRLELFEKLKHWSRRDPLIKEYQLDTRTETVSFFKKFKVSISGKFMPRPTYFLSNREYTTRNHIT